MLTTTGGLCVERTTAEEPQITKLGTIDCDLVEASPIVFKDRLYRFEYVRAQYKPNKTGDSYFRFVDYETGSYSPAFAAGYELGSALVSDDAIFVYGVEKWGGSEIFCFDSKDMKSWEKQTALSLPRWEIFNTSVCKGRGCYIMAFEVGGPPEVAGVPFTTRFAQSDDLKNWRLLPEEMVYSKERYTACPSIRFVDDFYYMFYLEAKPGPEYETYLVRSKDLVHWELSPRNPVLAHTERDKAIANPRLTGDERARIAQALNRNNSDFDLCEFRGKVFITYSWGNQEGNEFLAEARYAGSLKSLLSSFFR